MKARRTWDGAVKASALARKLRRLGPAPAQARLSRGQSLRAAALRVLGRGGADADAAALAHFALGAWKCREAWRAVDEGRAGKEKEERDVDADA